MHATSSELVAHLNRHWMLAARLPDGTWLTAKLVVREGLMLQGVRLYWTVAPPRWWCIGSAARHVAYVDGVDAGLERMRTEGPADAWQPLMPCICRCNTVASRTA